MVNMLLQHSVHSRNPSLSISFSQQTKSKNCWSIIYYVIRVIDSARVPTTDAEQCAPIYLNLN